MLDQFTQIIVDTDGDEKLEEQRRQTELPPLIEIHKMALENLLALNQQNRFWTGEKTYTEINDYIDVLVQLISAYSEYDVDRINELNVQRDSLRRGVTSIRDGLLGE